MSTRKRLSLKEKIRILDDYEKGLRIVDLCKKYNLKKSTACTIIKLNEKLKKHAERTNFAFKNRKAMTNG